MCCFFPLTDSIYISLINAIRVLEQSQVDGNQSSRLHSIITVTTIWIIWSPAKWTSIYWVFNLISNAIIQCLYLSIKCFMSAFKWACSCRLDSFVIQLIVGMSPYWEQWFKEKAGRCRVVMNSYASKPHDK